MEFETYLKSWNSPAEDSRLTAQTGSPSRMSQSSNSRKGCWKGRCSTPTRAGSIRGRSSAKSWRDTAGSSRCRGRGTATTTQSWRTSSGGSRSRGITARKAATRICVHFSDTNYFSVHAFKMHFDTDYDV